jgi:hypothetical protein
MAALAVAILVFPGLGCARPYAGPKTLAALGVSLLAAGGTTWIVGDRRDSDRLAVTGMVTAAVGAVAVGVAGGWLATGVACTEDPDCPRTQECREIPAPPGGVPYRQCMNRLRP